MIGKTGQNLGKIARPAACRRRAQAVDRDQPTSRNVWLTARTNVLVVTTGGDRISRSMSTFTRRSVSRQRLYSNAANVKLNNRTR